MSPGRARARLCKVCSSVPSIGRSGTSLRGSSPDAHPETLQRTERLVLRESAAVKEIIKNIPVLPDDGGVLIRALLRRALRKVPHRLAGLLSIPGKAEAILCSKREISAATGSPFFLDEMRSTASMVRRMKPMMMIPAFTSFSRYPL